MSCPPTSDLTGRLISNSSSSSNSDDEAWDRLFSTRPTFNSPLCITVALGFDTFVVMRHGQRKALSHTQQQQLPHQLQGGEERKGEKGKEGKSEKGFSASSEPSQSGLLSCYFCNDLSAPVDSLARRPLDQQCTVTRPGISLLASSVAAELIAALSQHPLAPDAPHSALDHGPTDSRHSCLGSTPHCVRGTLGDFRLVCTETEAFDHCIGCSLPIAQKVCSPEKVQFIAEAIARSEMLEEVSGLAAMKGCRREEEIFTFDEVEE